ncbi:hypothetical protein IMCC20628_00499 [Hoeflea sp. IMCC20628]|nr:hypothetical protein IMCC20628_00499 [Hoeflea sp. IMCC20628]
MNNEPNLGEILVAGARFNHSPHPEIPSFSVFRFIPRRSPNYRRPQSKPVK